MKSVVPSTPAVRVAAEATNSGAFADGKTVCAQTGRMLKVKIMPMTHKLLNAEFLLIIVMLFSMVLFQKYMLKTII